MWSHSFTNIETGSKHQELWPTMHKVNKESGNKALGTLTYNFTCLPSPIHNRATPTTSLLFSTLCPTMGGVLKTKIKGKKQTKTRGKKTNPKQTNKQNYLSPEGLKNQPEAVEKCQVRNRESSAHQGLSRGGWPPRKTSSFKTLPWFFSASFHYID